MIRFSPPDRLLVEIDPKGGDNPFILAAPLGYRGHVVQVTVPKGFRYDFASVPRILWPVISHADPRIVRAATIHDYLYRKGKCGRSVADAIFFDIMKYDEFPALKRWAAYLAVRVFGWRAWKG